MSHFLKVVLAAALLCGTATPATAQQAPTWEFSLVPMYFWATSLDGTLAAGPVSVPIALDFSDAADHLGGAFSFHFEASRGRFGVMTDLNFIKLTSSAPFSVGSRQITGDFELDNVMFEAAGLYELHHESRLSVIGGLRTYTLAPVITFRETGPGVTPVDESRTSADAFAGVVLRPRINDKWGVIARADIGAGNADLTWSVVGGLEYRFKPWGGLEFGYKALGIDVEGGENNLRSYDVTHSGPIVGLRLHWQR
ncbi:MAG TPA: hypothetical protein VD833_21435 [Vicinamibacterales bacterium]|nr:hypothetical protein [Vicinamibacterales bacterium]